MSYIPAKKLNSTKCVLAAVYDLNNNSMVNVSNGVDYNNYIDTSMAEPQRKLELAFCVPRLSSWLYLQCFDFPSVL